MVVVYVMRYVLDVVVKKNNIEKHKGVVLVGGGCGGLFITQGFSTR